MRRQRLLGPMIVMMLLTFVIGSVGLTEDVPTEVDPDECRLIEIPKCQIHIVDRALLAAGREGIVKTVAVKVGQRVTKGSELIHLRDDLARANQELADARASNDVNVRYSKEVFRTAQEEYKTALELERREAGSAQQVRQRKLEFERGQLSLEQAEFDQEIAGLTAEQASAELNEYHVRAPFNGTIRQVMKVPGESVQDGEPLVELVSTERVQIVGYGKLEELWDVRPGEIVDVQLDAPELKRFGVTEMRFSGRLIHVDDLVQPVTGKIRVVAEVTNQNNILRDGLRAHMRIFARHTSDSTASSENTSP